MAKKNPRTQSATEQQADIMKWVYSRYLPWTPLDPSYGVELTWEIADEVRERFSGEVHWKLLDRVVAEIHDRRWVPRETELEWSSVEWKIEQLSRRLRRSRNLSGGDPLIREELDAALTKLSACAERLTEMMGDRGHNGSPLRDEKWNIVPESMQTIRQVVQSVRDDCLADPNPKPMALLDAAKALHAEASRNDRLQDRFDLGLDAFAKGYGDQLGKNLAHGTTALFMALLWSVITLLAYLCSHFAAVDSPSYLDEKSIGGSL